MGGISCTEKFHFGHPSARREQLCEHVASMRRRRRWRRRRLRRRQRHGETDSELLLLLLLVLDCQHSVRPLACLCLVPSFVCFETEIARAQTTHRPQQPPPPSLAPQTGRTAATRTADPPPRPPARNAKLSRTLRCIQLKTR